MPREIRFEERPAKKGEAPGYDFSEVLQALVDDSDKLLEGTGSVEQRLAAVEGVLKSVSRQANQSLAILVLMGVKSGIVTRGGAGKKIGEILVDDDALGQP